MKIVEFKDGTYAIRRWFILGYQYLDLESENIIWWNKDDTCFDDCLTTDFEYIKEKFKNYKKPKNEDYGIPRTIDEQVIKSL